MVNRRKYCSAITKFLLLNRANKNFHKTCIQTHFLNRMNWICQREYKWREVELGLIPELLLYLRQRCVLCAEVLRLLGPKDDSTEMARFSELISCVILAFKPFPWLPFSRGAKLGQLLCPLTYCIQCSLRSCHFPSS